MVHLWSSARKLKCGDDGYKPAKGVVDPMESNEDKKTDKSTSSTPNAGNTGQQNSNK